MLLLLKQTVNQYCMMAEAVRVKSKPKSKAKVNKSSRSSVQKVVSASVELSSDNLTSANLKDDAVDMPAIVKLCDSETLNLCRTTEHETERIDCSNEEPVNNLIRTESSNDLISDTGNKIKSNITIAKNRTVTLEKQVSGFKSDELSSASKLQTPSAPQAQEPSTAYSYSASSSYSELRKLIESNEYQSKHSHLYPTLPSVKSEAMIRSQVPLNSVSIGQVTTSNVTKNIYPELYNENQKLQEETESTRQVIFKEMHLTSNEMRPLPKEQLLNLYTNSELKENEKYISSFIRNEQSVEQLDFYQLILKYQGAREDYAQSKECIEKLEVEYRTKKDQIWEFSPDTVTETSCCMDRKTVKAVHPFIRISYNPETHDAVKNTLKDIYEEVKHYCLHLHVMETTKRLIECHLHSISSSPFFKDIPETAPVTGYQHRKCSKRDADDLNHLKQCISVLFSFQRRLTKDEDFLKETRIWLSSLVALLLRVATFEDHLFILNHILRCPANVGSWAAGYIQSPVLPSWLNEKNSSSGLQSRLLDHTITILATLLMPIRSREAFLQHCKSSVMLATGCDTPQDSRWVFVDSDNEEDLDPFDMWLRWEESDIVSFFNQVPFGSMFRFLLEIEEIDGVERYIPEKYESKSVEMLKLFSVATHLVSIFHEGFKTFRSGKYRRLTKFITRYISDSVKYVCEHWENVKKINKFDSAFTKRLEVEFDEFIFRSVNCIASAPRKEAWQFLIFPYRCVSSDMMWKLAWVLFNSSESEQEISLPVSDLILRLQDEKLKNAFQDKIDSLEFIEAYYLLSALAEMVNSRGNDETLFVCTITKIVFEVAFTALSVREKMSKDGRDLLKSIVEKHPYVVSSILRELKLKIKDVGKASIYLFKELPLHGWKPTPEDISIIYDWLLSDDFPLKSFSSQLARLIISNMNWGKNSEGTELMLDISIHHRIAVLIVEAYGKYIKVQDSKSYIVWTYEQLAWFASAVKSTVVTATATDEEGFSKWAWEMLFTLKLHCLDQAEPPYEEVLKGCVIRDGIPTIHQDTRILPLSSIDDIPVNCTACYVAILLTSIGHRADLIVKDGCNLLSKLIENKQYVAAISILPYIMPFFYRDFTGLVKNEMFNKCIQRLLTADIDDMSYLQKALKNVVSSESLGKVLPVMASMIKFQIEESKHMGASQDVVKLWLKVLFEILISAIKSGKLEQWRGATQIYYLLDEISRIAFVDTCTREAALEEVKTLVKHVSLSVQEGNSFIDTLASLIPRSPQKASLLSDSIPSERLWFSWYVILLELDNSNSKNIWKQVLSELAAQPSITVGDAVKKVAGSLKIKLPINCLPIYKWSQQIMKSSSTHPLLPLFCQQFFIYYFQRITNLQSLTGIGSLGRRFFENSGLLGSIKEISIRLQTARDDNYKLSVNYEAELSNSDKNRIPLNEQHRIMEKKVFHEKLVKLYSAFILWLDAPRLHEASLVVSDLPVSYLPDQLSCILSLNMEPWYLLVDAEQLEKDLDEQLNSWHCYKKSSEISPCSEPSIEKESSEQHILKRLKKYTVPKSPPSIKRFKPVIEDLPVEIFYNYDTLKATIEKDLQILRENINWFSKKMSEGKSLDEVYHNNLMLLYKDVETKASYKISCSKGDEDIPGGCAGAAIIFITIEEKIIDEKIKQELEKNRITHHILLTSLREPLRPSFYSAAAHLSICLKMLSLEAEKAKQSYNFSHYNKLWQLGNSLFLYLMDCFDDEINSFQPTKTSLIEQLCFLFKEFIKGEHEDMQLLESLTSHPHVESLQPVVDLFDPMASGGNKFVEMYSCLVEKICKLPLDVASTLVKKFDVSEWLQSSKRMFSERNLLIHALGRALCGIGRELDGKQKIYKVYDDHLVILLVYNFPDHYNEILNMLLTGMNILSLPKEAWVTFFRALGLILPSEIATDNKEIIEQYAAKQQFLSVEQVLETLKFVGHHFEKCSNLEKTNLYEKYGYYIPSIINILTVMTHVHIYKTLSDILYNENDVLSNVWETMKETFGPWLHPTGKRSPWSLDHTDSAVLMFRSYTMCLCYLEKNVNEYLQGASFLPIIWRYYVEVYSKASVKEHVRITAQEHLSSLKWNEFSPELVDIQLMIQLVESKLPDNVNFVSNIFVKIPWTNINYLAGGANDATDTEILPVLTNLIVKLAWEPAVVEAGTLPQILRSAEACCWHLVRDETLVQVVNTFVEKCNCQCILQEKQNGSMDAILLRFLRITTCMEPLELLQKYPNTLHHRLLYVKTCVRLLIQCAVDSPELLKDKKNLFLGAIQNILQQIEFSTLYNVVQSDRFKQTVKMIGQFLVILSDAPQADLRDVVMAGLTKWFETKPTTYLVLPCIQASCRSVNCMQYLVEIVECCITKHFLTSKETTYILKYLSVPEPYEEEFLNACSKENLHLSQYIFIEQKLLECKDNEDILNMLVSWNEQANPQQASEQKLILLWDKIIDLSLRQIAAGNESAVKDKLERFVKKVSEFGKESSLISFLNKAPYQVTQRFRFLSRFVASYISVQIPMNGSIRTAGYAEGHITYSGASSPTAKEKTFSDVKCKPSSLARKALQELENLLKWGKYSNMKTTIEKAVNSVMDANYHLGNLRTLLKQFTIEVYGTSLKKFLELLNEAEPVES